jgi:hypothetical protein
VCELAQEPMKLCVIFDDITDLVEAASKDNTEILVGGNEKWKVKALFDHCMTKICTKGRHMGTVFIALHSAKSISVDLK